ncbi:hypothetical protein M422DRAFT_164044 [Sphaerobolus stellatus SS14]|nr:hypothetical protein M422DRAFT_164044 [Sphaerobolus stellatus SS14]
MGGGGGIILQAILTKQPLWEPWSFERLVCECTVAISLSLESSTSAAYKSHLQSYLAFCHNNNLPINPTSNTLSFYVVYMCHHLKPITVSTYLSGICHLLELY